MAVIGKSHSILINSKLRSHKGGWVCAMNIRDLHLEYESGCILKVTFLAAFLGLDLIYLCTYPLSEAHMGSRH